MLLLSSFCVVGLGTLLISELPRNKGQETSLISTAVLTVGAVSLVVGSLFALIVHFVSPALGALGSNIQNILLFAAGVFFTSITTIIDQALIAMLKGQMQFLRNTLFTLIKLGMLFLISIWLSNVYGITIYTTWTIGNAVSLIPLIGLMLWKGERSLKAYRPQLDWLKKLGPAAVQHHIFNLIIQTPTQMLPVLVAAMLSTKINGAFYIASMIASFIYAISQAMTTVLHAVNAADTSKLAQKARLTVGISLAVSAAGTLILLVANRQILGIFGPNYAGPASVAICILAGAAFPMTIKNHYIALCRITDRIKPIIIPVALGSLCEIVAAAAGARYAGLNGLSMGWVLALCGESLFMLPVVFKTLTNKALPQGITGEFAQLELADPANWEAIDWAKVDVDGSPTQKIRTLISITDTITSMAIVNAPTAEVRRTEFLMRQTQNMAAALPVLPATPAPARDFFAQINQLDTPPVSPKESRSSNKTAVVAENTSVDKESETRSLSFSERIKSIRALDIVYFVIPLIALALWFTALPGIQLKGMNDLGLISVFPPTLLIALGLVAVSFCLTLQRSQLRAPLLILQLGILVFMLYGITPLIEEAPRFDVVYRHAGYTEYIMRTASVDPNLDAYFNWPGFFNLVAFITKLAGYSSILSYADWAPLFYSTLYLAISYSLFSLFTDDKRIVWLGLLFFCITDWIWQDYFSPQGLNFFLYLVMLTIILKWFRTPPTQKVSPLPHTLARIPYAKAVYAWLRTPDRPGPSSTSAQRIVLLAFILLIFFFDVFSHQLTPFFTIMTVGVLVISRRCTLWWLLIAMVVITGAWILLMTQAYLSGHVNDVLGGLLHLGSSLGSSVSQNVTGRLVGNPNHTFVVQLRLVATASIWGLAFIGTIRRLRAGHVDTTMVLLAATPLPLFIIQPYGGEMLLRVYLFSLAPSCFLAASFFYTTAKAGKSRWTTSMVVVLSLLLLITFQFTRYGNERKDYMTNDEIVGAQTLYHLAPAGSVLLNAYDGAPLQFQDYEKYDLEVLPITAYGTEDMKAMTKFVAQQQGKLDGKTGGVYLYYSRAEQASFDQTSGYAPKTLSEVEAKLVRTGDFQLVYKNAEVRIYRYTGISIAGGVKQ